MIHRLTCDAIAEGEFFRLHHMHKLQLVLYRGHGHTKYAFELFRLKTQISATCTARMVQQLKFGRFFNYPLDLHMEHLICEQKSQQISQTCRNLGG